MNNLPYFHIPGGPGTFGHMCPMCSKNFSKAFHLQRHMRFVHKNEERPRGKAVQTGNLAGHRKLHFPATGNALRKKCDICGKTARVKNMERHRKLHFHETQDELRSKCDMQQDSQS